MHAQVWEAADGPTVCAPFVNLNTNLASLIFPFPFPFRFTVFIGGVVTLPENATTYARDYLFMVRVE